MKEALKTFLGAGLSFGIVAGVLFGIFGGYFAGLLFGVLSGALFGLILSIFYYIQKRKFEEIRQEMSKSKSIIMDGAANHFRGVEGVGGWLLLTSDEIIFKSHAYNIQTHETQIPLNKIAQVKGIATAGLIPNGLHIFLTDGSVEKFVVNKRKLWIQTIDSIIHKLNGDMSSVWERSL